MKYVYFFIIVVLILFVSICCINVNTEKGQITKNAKEYFSAKYNVSKFKFRIRHNNFYDENERCWMSCGENAAKIIYNKKEYKIIYDASKNSYGDNYQYEKINSDFNKYLLDQIPYATSIKINSLEHDVLVTPEKYTGDVENYIKNTIVRTLLDGGCYTFVTVWIESKDSAEAKELHSKYKKELITKLNNLGISYIVNFSKKETDNEYFAFYYYSVGDGIRTAPFRYWDKVDNYNENHKPTMVCDRKSIAFSGDEIICNRT